MVTLRQTAALVLSLSLGACSPPAPTQDARVDDDAAAPQDSSVTDSAVRDATARDATASEVSTPSDGGIPDVEEVPLQDFLLTDSNPRSPTFNMPVTLSGQAGSVAVFYFATAACAFCTEMAHELDRMKTELAGMATTVPVKFFVIADLDSDGAALPVVQATTLPLLQDTHAVGVQRMWQATLRDVIVIDAERTRRLVYNLTPRPLTQSQNYNDLRTRIVAIANR
ncbi:MAG: hypothetical protein Q8Q09_25595 [Deltaproteobacteria bacterium]|nr:hypothetical protein [Deltaproteobacteria bacterium]